MKKVLLSLLGIIGVAGIGTAVYSTVSKSNEEASSATDPSSTPSPSTAASASAQTTAAAQSSDTTYKDGTYTASGSYVSPAGQDSISVKVTVSNDTVTAVTVTPQSPDPEGEEYQKRFARGISSIVVGKPLGTNFNVSEVNGSSLTGTGFSQALSAIRSQAKS